MVSQERKQQLALKGYFVEDMGAEYGPEFEGQFRWMNSLTGDFQDFDTSLSEESAWKRADRYESQQ